MARKFDMRVTVELPSPTKSVGEGDVDLVYVPDFVSNLACGWDYPLWRDFYMRLARSFRLILFDKRGTGISDHGSQYAALETRMEDLHAVLDAAESPQPVIFGAHEGGGMAVLFAATYPERTRALVLFHAQAKSDDGGTELAMEELARLRDGWGTQEYADELLATGCPSLAADEESRRWFANSLRVGASPAVAYALNRAFTETDLRDILPAVHVPTLLLHRSVEEDATMEVASLVPGARTMRVSGSDYFGIFLSPEIVDEIERFVAGEIAPEIPESVLATVMFTDIVGSTEHVAEIGDRAWRDLLAQASCNRASRARPVPRAGARHRRRRLLRNLRRASQGDPGSGGDRRRRPHDRPGSADRHPCR